VSGDQQHPARENDLQRVGGNGWEVHQDLDAGRGFQNVERRRALDRL